jgi:opacity protein-like surface antigen
MAFRISTLALVAILSTTSAQAADLSVDKTRLRGGLKDVHAAPVPEPQSQIYSAWRGGFTWREDATIDAASDGQMTTAFESGWFMSTAIRVSFAKLGLRGFRGEIETGIARSYVKAFHADGATFHADDAQGRAGLGFVTANVAYDFNISADAKLKPYISAGVGYGIANLRNYAVNSLGGTYLSDHDDGLVYQLGAGASYYIGAGVRAELGYRYIAMPRIDLISVNGTHLTTKLADHQVLLGLRKGW